MSVSTPSVSCLCVTRDRVPFLRRAVACYRTQTLASRELVIQYLDDDHATRTYVESLDDDSIRCVELPAQPRPSLGARRDLAVQAARGRYIATWDDDDWYASTRLEEQVRTLENTGAGACLLKREMFFDVTRGDVYVSGARGWENSLVALRETMPAYPDADRAEDTAAVAELARTQRIALLDRPELYVRTLHGGNTTSIDHWRRNLLPSAQRLDDAQTKQVLGWLDIDPDAMQSG